MPEAYDAYGASLLAKLNNLGEILLVKTVVDYGYGYRCFPFISQTGKPVFVVHSCILPPPAGGSIICKVFRLDNFVTPVEIGDLYALDARAIFASQPFVTLNGSVLVPTQDSPSICSNMLIWRCDGTAWTAVYTDTNINVTTVAHFAQDPVTKAIYGGYRNNLNSRVVKSLDDGLTWALVYDNVEANIANAYIYGCAAYNNNVLLTKRDKRVYIRSADGGATWAESAVAPTYLRTASIFGDLGLSFITSDDLIHYSRDYFVTYRRIRVKTGGVVWTSRYSVRVGGRLLLSTASPNGTVVLASRDLYHTVTPVFSVDGSGSQRIAGYGDYLLVGSELYGALIRATLPKTLERGLSCSILLWESEAVAAPGGATTDYVEAQYNEEKTFYIYSNQAGTLNIQAYDEVAAVYRTVDTVAVAATTLTTYKTTYGARLMCLNFVPGVNAVVSAWAVLE